MGRRATLVIGMFVAVGFSAPAWAGCWSDTWEPYVSCVPPGFYGCVPHLGLGPGYPGLFPPAYSCPPGFGFPRTPPQIVVLIPGPPVPIYVNPEGTAARRQTPEHDGSETTSRKADYRDEIARARKLYPKGIPAIEYVWSPDRGGETLQDSLSKEAPRR
jgi:hypothetical protein